MLVQIENVFCRLHDCSHKAFGACKPDIEWNKTTSSLVWLKEKQCPSNFVDG